ncbi:MAG: NADP-dependent malic enzyme [Alphaproteobacteria bacterium]|nr:NADP-dependent malic enzyme [Alphaproteobacteria bacterium]
MADNRLSEDALTYHRRSPAGKLSVVPTKPLANQRDLALAYSPGVAAACDAITENEGEAATVTARGNLVGVVTNGTAVLGLGDIGPLASKPVMEGKAVLFKEFAGINVFDIEVDERDPDRFVDIVAALEPTFGAINLEDIRAPECFDIEQKLRDRMNIPVFHDDQHGTAIIVAAAIVNALDLVGKKLEEVKLVASGAGAAALACLNLLVDMGMPRSNIWVTDIEGVVYKGRKEQMDPCKALYAQETNARSLDEVIGGAEVFLGLSAPGVLKPDMVRKMSKRPVIMALANPVPEILPEEARDAAPDAIIATGRSDYPNQVNNVLCFPFIFRGALDVGATEINEEMKIACVKALAALAQAESSEIVAKAYGDQSLQFGPDYLIPKPFDPRLITEIAPAVAQAAMDSGVATRPIEDLRAYRQTLTEFVWKTGLVMKPVFDQARADPKRVAFTDGEDERVLHAVQVAVDEGLAKPILIGRRAVVADRIKRLGLRIRLDEEVALVDPERDDRYHEYWTAYYRLMARNGVSPDLARRVVRTRTTAIGALMLRLGDADAMICGAIGQFQTHLRHVGDIIGKRDGVRDLSALILLVMPHGLYFIADTHVTADPTAEEIVELALLASDEVRRFGIVPKIALLSHSNFGSSRHASAAKMREAAAILHRDHPDLEVEGEMHADAAIDTVVRERIFPDAKLEGSANLLIMPNIDAANISYNLVRVLGEGLIAVGPMLLGTAYPANIVTSSISARGLLNMTALSVVEAQALAQGGSDAG